MADKISGHRISEESAYTYIIIAFEFSEEAAEDGKLTFMCCLIAVDTATKLLTIFHHSHGKW
jgi:hypothetical protein